MITTSPSTTTTMTGNSPPQILGIMASQASHAILSAVPPSDTATSATASISTVMRIGGTAILATAFGRIDEIVPVDGVQTPIDAGRDAGHIGDVFDVIVVSSSFVSMHRIGSTASTAIVDTGIILPLAVGIATVIPGMDTITGLIEMHDPSLGRVEFPLGNGLFGGIVATEGGLRFGRIEGLFEVVMGAGGGGRVAAWLSSLFFLHRRRLLLLLLLTLSHVTMQLILMAMLLPFVDFTFHSSHAIVAHDIGDPVLDPLVRSRGDGRRKLTRGIPTGVEGLIARDGALIAVSSDGGGVSCGAKTCVVIMIDVVTVVLVCADCGTRDDGLVCRMVMTRTDRRGFRQFVVGMIVADAAFVIDGGFGIHSLVLLSGRIQSPFR
mmetsp:Transcript_10915/g.22791  ORF Transcript_10915/g.22791 Transcript_10915/m.22791 type:complete len:379 (+) Transcript_10915:1814-2950(+)